MKNTFGSNLTLTLFGESHGAEIGAVLDGMPAGIPVDEDEIARCLSLRRPAGSISTARREADEFRIVSGVYRGVTTGTPICVLIPNRDVKSEDYDKISRLARPGHADYTGFVKYHGANDPRGGGHFSGRLTAPIVAVGAILLSALRQKGIGIGTHIARCAGISDRAFGDLGTDIEFLRTADFAVLDPAAGEEMKKAIEAARADGDSVGGILETIATGLPAGLGDAWFGSVESSLSAAIFGIPAIKGISFGDGFSFADRRGSEVNGSYRMEAGKVVTVDDHNGGVLGGITSGAPLRFSCVVKPTPSIAKEQETVDFVAGTNATLQVSGRHDPAIVHRARIVVDCVTALVLCDFLAGQYGADWLRG